MCDLEPFSEIRSQLYNINYKSTGEVICCYCMAGLAETCSHAHIQTYVYRGTRQSINYREQTVAFALTCIKARVVRSKNHQTSALSKHYHLLILFLRKELFSVMCLSDTWPPHPLDAKLMTL